MVEQTPNNTFCHVDIPVSNINQASQFYEKVFGWEVKPAQDQGYALIPGGGLRLKEPDTSDSTINYIHVDNLDASLSKIEAAGGQVIIRKEPSGKGYCAVFKDPGGTVLGLYAEQ